MRHNVVAEHLKIKKGESISTELVFEKGWADAAVLTMYSPVNGIIEVSARGDGKFYALINRGVSVKVLAGAATNIPAAACYSLRLNAASPVPANTEVELQALLDV